MNPPETPLHDEGIMSPPLRFDHYRIVMSREKYKELMDRLDFLEAENQNHIRDTVETDTAIRKSASRVIPHTEANGDSVAVPPIEDVAERVVVVTEFWIEKCRGLEAEHAKMKQECDIARSDADHWEKHSVELQSQLAEVNRSLKREQDARIRAERERDWLVGEKEHAESRLKVAVSLIAEAASWVQISGFQTTDQRTLSAMREFAAEFLTPQPDPREVLRGKIKRTEHAADYVVMALNGRLVTAMNISTNGEQWFAFYPHRENGGDEFDTMAEAVTAGENHLIDRALESEGQGKGDGDVAQP